MKYLIIKPDNTIRVMLETNDNATLMANVEDGDVVHECPIGFDISVNTYNPITKEVGTKSHVVIANIKNDKIMKINKIKVTTASGKEFDGDEISQDRMNRAVNIAMVTGQTITQWKLADNSIMNVTLDELKEALILSVQEMSRIWLD